MTDFDARVNANAAVGHWKTRVLAELDRARTKFGPMADEWEGAAVLQEKVDELWHEIKHGAADRINMRGEAVQVGAMALRLLEDVFDDDRDGVMYWATLHAHHGFPSPHAGYAHLWSAMDELHNEMRANGEYRHNRMLLAARVVALVALRFLVAFGGDGGN